MSEKDYESKVMVIDIRQLIVNEAYERGLDPKGLDTIRSKTSDKTKLVVQVEGKTLHTDG